MTGFYKRFAKYRKTFSSYRSAVPRPIKYNYSRDDEEIYKEFLEIANELIPHIMKVESSGFSANTILKKPECFANLLRFYDGICQWEEGSATPVLHIGWAKPLVNTISKFDSDVRAQLHIVCDKFEVQLPKKNDSYFNNNNYEKENGSNDSDIGNPFHSKSSNENDQSTSNFHPTIEALTAACSEKILNPEYLLQGDGSPFVGGECNEAGSSGQIETNLTGNDEQQNGKPSTSNEEIDTKALIKAGGEPIDNRPTIILHSQKMKQLKDLLLAEKLNTHAISLHLTAQSQVQIGKKGRNDNEYIRPKRARRE